MGTQGVILLAGDTGFGKKYMAGTTRGFERGGSRESQGRRGVG